MATTTPALAEHEHGHPGIVLAALALASVMSVMDLFIVNVALPDIASDLHSSLSDVAWVLNAYALFFGALLVPAGRFSDKYGRKNVFMLGLAVFTIASLACAVSPDLSVLIAFRGVQAIGAAMLIPSSLGLVLTTMPPEREAQRPAVGCERRGRGSYRPGRRRPAHVAELWGRRSRRTTGRWGATRGGSATQRSARSRTHPYRPRGACRPCRDGPATTLARRRCRSR